MDVELLGTGGPDGWPAADCRCASCRRALAAGEPRAPLRVRIGGRFEPPGSAPPPGHTMINFVGGYELTGPAIRLIYAARPPQGAPVPPAGGYDVALVDLLDAPETLGALRRLGAAGPHTDVIAVGLDHRVSSPAELYRRAAYWGVRVVPDRTPLRPVGTVPRPRPRPDRVLLLGGARSGKSAEAERRLAGEPYVRYVATGEPGDGDPEWRARVQAHVRRRPHWWSTTETLDLPAALGRPGEALLIDGLGTWLARTMDELGLWESARPDLAPLHDRIARLAGAWRGTVAHVVAVSDETGLGVVPATPAGRLFRDELGRLNAAIAAESEEVALVVAGRVTPLPG
ncbi:MAG: bifunctional adenosylcobinamide kinase/adenosylcobinamide-phosphate guanylyltransferase [Streptosporangiales bacterium]|nr:bifunctional adenosylcobinamide kinase/adenosylcobinamide-phosphate guanylyltransferase [Streptosporangiales bacterium]